MKGKGKRKDVADFSINLADNIFKLHKELARKTYRHGGYVAFKLNDPKPRDIHKALVRDRLVHHAIYRVLYSYFDNKFIFDSYSCRKDKGTHKAINRFREFGRKVSRNNSKTCWVLKCDIRKFFANIDHEILNQALRKYIKDEDVFWLLREVIESFHSDDLASQGVALQRCRGLPLGNLTSQLLINIYMNEFDQFVKHGLKVKYYIRYADDFVILDQNKNNLDRYTCILAIFLKENLKLELHPDKLFIKTFASGVDFLGWVNFPHHRVLRTSTKRRMIKNLENISYESTASYLGIISHGDTYKFKIKYFK